jgi:hypothetical protein
LRLGHRRSWISGEVEQRSLGKIKKLASAELFA